MSLVLVVTMLSISFRCSFILLNISECIVIGKDAKDVPRGKALEYVAAYTCGNDISSRKLQRDQTLAGRVPQWGFSKGFDTYAPLGPCLVASYLIPDPSQVRLQTIIDGEMRQDEMVSDMVFDSAYIIFLPLSRYNSTEG